VFEGENVVNHSSATHTVLPEININQ